MTLARRGRPLEYPEGDYNLGGRERYRAKVRMMVAFLGGRCTRCGVTNEDYYVDHGTDLEIDHVDPELKEFNPKAFWAYRWETIQAELTKCQLLCHPCHVEKTNEDRGDYVPAF